MFKRKNVKNQRRKPKFLKSAPSAMGTLKTSCMFVDVQACMQITCSQYWEHMGQQSQLLNLMQLFVLAHNRLNLS